MKKTVITLWVFLSTALLMAGGDVNPNLSAVADIPNKICKANKIYIEKDAQLMWQDQAYVDAEDGAYKRHHSVAKAGTWKHGNYRG
jgi:predicted transcriptional regulator